ncbi:MAG: hypothetical protein JO116_22445 [Planctomycetaceae bacterium]|nr:hypothetical protein [Planctomycetaceae bacterium]
MTWVSVPEADPGVQPPVCPGLHHDFLEPPCTFPPLEAAGQSERRNPTGEVLELFRVGLDLKPDRVFGYWFDFGDDWYHQVQVERVEQAIPIIPYPHVVKRVRKSPPQYRER